MSQRLFVTFFLILTTVITLNTVQCQKDLKQVAVWMEMEYNFPSQADRDEAIASGKYISGNSLPIDVDVNYRGNGLPSRVFVTVPRFAVGVPVTLGTISSQGGRGGPLLDPYPNYSWHSSHGQDCDGITSVFRVSIDECNRIWILDTGRIGDTQYCAPQLLIFNLDTDVLIHRYRFPASDYKPGVSLFVTPVLDVRDVANQCRNTMVYIADVTGYGIVMYDYNRDISWRAQNKLVYPHPPHGTFTISRESFDIMDGVIGMALTPKTTNVQKNYGGYYSNQYSKNVFFYLFFRLI